MLIKDDRVWSNSGLGNSGLCSCVTLHSARVLYTYTENSFERHDRISNCTTTLHARHLRTRATVAHGWSNSQHNTNRAGTHIPRIWRQACLYPPVSQYDLGHQPTPSTILSCPMNARLVSWLSLFTCSALCSEWLVSHQYRVIVQSLRLLCYFIWSNFDNKCNLVLNLGKVVIYILWLIIRYIFQFYNVKKV